MEQGIDPIKRRSIMQEPKWSRSSPSIIMLESEHRNKRDTASEESKAKEKVSDRKKRCIQRESSGDR